VPIAVIQEDGLLGIAAGGDVVESAGKFEAEWASQETRHDGAGSAKSRTDPASPDPYLFSNEILQAPSAL